MNKEAREFRHATLRGKRRLLTTPRAIGAWYVRDELGVGLIRVLLNNGFEISFPPGLIPGFLTAHALGPQEMVFCGDTTYPQPKQKRKRKRYDKMFDVIEITHPGYGLHFPKFDGDLWVPALLEAVTSNF